MITRTEHFRAGYDYRSRFRDLAQVGSNEGGAVFIASDGLTPVFISDESTLVDLLGEEEESEAIAVRFFSDLASRDTYMRERLARMRGAPETGVGLGGQTLPRTPPPGRHKDPFRTGERLRQARFIQTMSPESRAVEDAWGKRHAFLLPLGREEENLLEALRGPGGAAEYCTSRGIRWWKSSATGDDCAREGPTRNTTSSQVACVNMLLPFRDQPAVLTAMLRELDPEIVDVAAVPYTALDGTPGASLVELEWTGSGGTLEGHGSRGAYATSADACLIGVTATGQRRLFLFEFKYTESYRQDDWKGAGAGGARRREAYRERYAAPASSFSGAAPFDEVLCEPFYQIVRLGLLGDAAKARADMRLSGVRVVVVCPEGNTAYRERITSTALAKRFADAETVEAVARRLWKRPSEFSMIDPASLVAAASAAGASHAWTAYMRARYG